MFAYPPKTNCILMLAIMVMLSATFIGCGDSQGVTALNAHLSEFSELVADYKTTIATDKSKQAELDAKVEAMAAKWADIRNEFGSDVTPQKMDQLVQQYESLISTLNSFKKTIGS